MVAGLDVLLQEMVDEEAEAESVFTLLKEFAGIDVLIIWHMDVAVSKVVVEAVTDEDAAEVEEDPEFFVSYF